MTTLDRQPDATAVRAATRPYAVGLPVALVTALASGVALGLGDLLWMTRTAWPLAAVANTAAPWAVGAFLLGAALRVSPTRAAVAAALMQVVAVETYYAGAVLMGMGDTATLWSPTTRMWLAFGVIAGLVWGPAGAWFRRGPWWAAGFGLGATVGVLGGEAMLIMGGLIDQPSFSSGLTGAAEALLALAALLLVLAVPRPLVALVGALTAVPVAIVCAAAFAVAGFGM